MNLTKGNTSTSVLLGIIAVLVIGFFAYLAISDRPGNVTTPEPVIIGDSNPSGASAPSAPTATTRGTSYVSSSTAVLNGEVSTNGTQTAYWYEYGPTSSMGSASGTQLIGGGYVKYSAPAAIYGLKANTTYYYRIVAENQLGRVFGQVANFKTAVNVPAPQYVAPVSQTNRATEITRNSAVLNGVTNPKGAMTDYWFEYGTSLSMNQNTPVLNAGADNRDISVSSRITGLQADTVYYFRLNSHNGYGITNGRILSFRTEPSSPPPPPEGDAPEANTRDANGITQTSATIRGQVDPNGSETTYYFEYGKSTLFGLFSLDQKTGEKSAGSGGALVDVSQALSSLDSDSTYYYRVVAKNKYGTSLGDIYSFTTQE